MTLRNANISKEVAGVELADRARQIAAQKRVSFGDALFQARRELADTVQVRQNVGSPLRDQKQSTTPSPADVRAATVEGVKAVGSLWNPGANPGIWLATSGAQVLKSAMAAVSVNLRALGMGPQITETLTTDLLAFLNNLITGGVLSFPNIVANAGDRIQQAYEDALKNRVDTQVWSEFSEEQFSEAVRLSDSGHTAVDVTSILLRDKALLISKQRGVSFGEALQIARRSLAEDVVQPDVMKQTVHTALRDKLSGMLQGKKKVVSRFDLKQAQEAAMGAVKKLNTSGYGEISDAVEGSLNGLFSGDQDQTAIDPADLESIAAKAGDSAAAAYSKHLKSVS